MIFVTTGTQLPFPRLVSAMDRLAATLEEEVIAQIGPDTAPYPHLETHPTLSPDRFATLFQSARLIVAHAGIGTVLSARIHAKPLVLMARRHDLGEHRNDHQLATAAALADQTGLYVAPDAAALEALLRAPDLVAMQAVDGPNLGRLTDFIGGWITPP
jgi:UDP-N-acetylglucosamine transferase subunit ALG13